MAACTQAHRLLKLVDVICSAIHSTAYSSLIKYCNQIRTQSLHFLFKFSYMFRTFRPSQKYYYNITETSPKSFTFLLYQNVIPENDRRGRKMQQKFNNIRICAPQIFVPTSLHALISLFVLKKLSLYKPVAAQETDVPRISKQSAHKGGKIVSPTHRPPLPPDKDPLYWFLLETHSTSGPQCGRND